MYVIPYGLQLYTLRDHLEDDVPGTLQKVRAIGYDHVELAGFFGCGIKEMKQILDDIGLKAVSGHFSYEDITGKTNAIASAAKILEIEYVVMPWIDHEERNTLAEWEEVAQSLDAAGAALRAEGLTLCYHNHAHELERYENRTVLDILFDNTAPENMAAELDVYWLKYAGEDPAAWIRKLAGRCPLVHLKDIQAGEPFGFRELGKGAIEWQEIFEACKEADVKWGFVEQDTIEGDAFESIQISLDFLRKAAEEDV